jgi:hypothetical protein
MGRSAVPARGPAGGCLAPTARAIRTIDVMSDLDQIRESIEARIVELKDEITALEATRVALNAKRAGRTTPAPSTKHPGRHRNPTAASNGSSTAAATETSDGAAPDVASVAAQEAPARSPKPRRRTQTKSSKSQKRVEVLLAGKLEAMLREAEDGLSAVAIAKRSNAGYEQVLDLLRHLESTGQIRRTGSRRTSLWRLITDEERIAARVAELERLSIAKSGS